jgi:2-keto-4-pentenoate hydratase
MLPPSRKYGRISIEEAYRIQDQYAERNLRRLGPVTGYKVALAGRAAREAWGVSMPVSAPLFARQERPQGGTVRLKDFVHFHIEAELAFVLGKDIEQPIADIGELKTYVAKIRPAFDIPDGRFESKPTVTDIIATGAGAHRYVLGPEYEPARYDPDRLSLKLLKDGRTVYEGPSRAVLRGQWHSLLWQVNQLVLRGKTLRAGQFVLTGAVDRPYSARGRAARGSYIGDAGALGQVRCIVK